MKGKAFRRRLWDLACVGLAASLFALATGCGSKGNGPAGVGAVRGTVQVPFELSASSRPAPGATVRLFGGDFDKSAVADSAGGFFFGSVPSRKMTLSAYLAPCLYDTVLNLQVIANDTVNQDLELSSAPSGECRGIVKGAVYLPFTYGQPFSPSATKMAAAGSRVRLIGPSFDATTFADAYGIFLFNSVPAGSLTLSAQLLPCLADTLRNLQLPPADSLDLSVVLTSQSATNCLGLPYAGAARARTDQATGRAALLYDTPSRSRPAVVILDLAAGQGAAQEFGDLDNVYDIAFVSSDEVVFNFKSGSAYGLRFLNVATMTRPRGDVIYLNDPGTFPGQGRIAVSTGHQVVFATQTVKRGLASFLGKTWAVSVPGDSLIDADTDPADGDAAFDDSLVTGSVGWAYNVAFDATADEILVGNRQSTFVTAIAWSQWGKFDRAAHLSVPTAGVRKITMNTDITGFGVVFWDFDQSTGIATAPLSGVTPILKYQSGGSASVLTYDDMRVSPVSDNHTLQVSDPLASWFTIFGDPSRPDSVRDAVEQRSLSTLQRVQRFETRVRQNAPSAPRAFTVNAATRRLYVGYQSHPYLEVFTVP